MKKPTVATLKSFIRKNETRILINVKSSFDGMTDSVESVKGGFTPLTRSTPKNAGFVCHDKNPTLGFNGVWLVGSSRDYIQPYNENGLQGFSVSNCCGSWVVAVREAA